MALFDWLVFFVALLFLGRGLEATSSGDAHPIYKACVEQCEKTGCIQDQCFNNCNFASDKRIAEGPWYLQEPFYLRWKEWDCRSDCRYHCMFSREEERQRIGDKPIKYHGKWPFRRLFGIQEPVSVALSTLNLALIFHGWLSFFILVYYKLPLRPNGKTYYEYTGLWHIYGILSMSSWFWSTVFHTRFEPCSSCDNSYRHITFLGNLGFIFRSTVTLEAVGGGRGVRYRDASRDYRFSALQGFGRCSCCMASHYCTSHIYMVEFYQR